jgi:hypothetical protein
LGDSHLFSQARRRHFASSCPAAVPHPDGPDPPGPASLPHSGLPPCLTVTPARLSASSGPASAPPPRHLARFRPVSRPTSALPFRPVSAPSPPCHPAPSPHFLVSMLMHLYTAGALLASRQPNIGCASCVVCLPSSMLISLKGEMRSRCFAGAAPTDEEVRNETSMPCASISRSAFLFYEHYSVVRSFTQLYAAVRSHCAAGAQPLRSGCAAIAQ